MDDEERRIALAARKDLVAFVMLGSALFTIAGAALTVQGVQAGMEGLFKALVAGLATLLFGLSSASLATTLVSSRPAFQVDDAGIYDNTSLMGAGLIKWEEIAVISYFHFMVQGYILIEPNDVSAFARQHNVLRRAVLWINSKISPASICIPQSYLDIAPWDLLRAIRTQYAPEIERYGIYVDGEPKKKHRSA